MANPTNNLFMNSSDRSADLPSTRGESLTDKCSELIDRIIDTMQKGKIRSPEQIYQMLVTGVVIGTGEIFERCLSDRLSSVQVDLDNLANSEQFFQRESPELKEARLQRSLRNLQQIQKQWEQWQQENQVKEAILGVVQQIMTAPTGDRFTTLLRAIDPNQQQALSLGQLQQLAQALKSAGESNGDEELDREIQVLAKGIERALVSCQQLENYLVRWLYEDQQNMGFGDGRSDRLSPWTMWAKQGLLSARCPELPRCSSPTS
jgi:hypothetical protein